MLTIIECIFYKFINWNNFRSFHLVNSLSIPFVSLPTAASHDGMASPFVSIKRDKPHSIIASALDIYSDESTMKSEYGKVLEIQRNLQGLN